MVYFQYLPPVFQLPRTYPEPFADAVCALHPSVLADGEGMPPVDESTLATEAFDYMSFHTWPEAHLVPCIRYFRGNKHLEPPQEWADVFPRPYEVSHQLGR